MKSSGIPKMVGWLILLLPCTAVRSAVQAWTLRYYEKPRSLTPGLNVSAVLDRSTTRAHPHHEAVEAELGHLLPSERVVAEGRETVMQLLEHRIVLVVLGVDLLRGGVARLEHRLRERPQDGALADELLERRRVRVVVLSDHPRPGLARRNLDHALVGLRQLVPLRDVDQVVALAAAFPPARIVVVLCHLHEAELLVVIRADPLGCIDRAFFQRRIDVAGGELLGYDTKTLKDRAGKPADAKFQALEVVDGLDFLTEESAHLRAGVARREADAIELREQLVHQLRAFAEPQPCVHAARVDAEGKRRAERERRVLAEVVVGRRVAHLDRAVLHRVENLQTGYDFAGCEHLDLEFVVAHLGDALREVFAAAVERIERLRPAGWHAPLHFRHRLCDRSEER